MIARMLLALAGALALTGCGQQVPEGFEGPPSPALWEVESPDGHIGWLFGTIHALPDGADWRTPEFEDALAGSSLLVVEVGNLADEALRADTFRRLATARNMPPLSERIAASQREPLQELMDRGGLSPGHFHRMDTWAAALTLSQIGRSGDSGNGVDRALLSDYSPEQVLELEGAEAQLAIFDRLPEAEQRDLLGGIVNETQRASADPLLLSRLWFRGHMAALVRERDRGIMADPELREALLTGRNTVWTERIANLLATNRRPFVAVGAAHMPGPDGLVAMLRARDLTVTRIQ